MKKCVLGLFTVIIFLVACGSSDNITSTEPQQNTSEQTRLATPQNDTGTVTQSTTSLKINTDTLEN